MFFFFVCAAVIILIGSFIYHPKPNQNQNQNQIENQNQNQNQNQNEIDWKLKLNENENENENEFGKSFAKSQRSNNEATLKMWNSFSSHRLKVTNIALSSSSLLLLKKKKEEEEERKAICILGAGNMNDVSLMELFDVYDDIHLVDIDGNAMISGLNYHISRNNRRRRRNYDDNIDFYNFHNFTLSFLQKDCEEYNNKSCIKLPNHKIKRIYVHSDVDVTGISTLSLSDINNSKENKEWKRDESGSFILSDDEASQLLLGIQKLFGNDGKLPFSLYLMDPIIQSDPNFLFSFHNHNISNGGKQRYIQILVNNYSTIRSSTTTSSLLQSNEYIKGYFDTVMSTCMLSQILNGISIPKSKGGNDDENVQFQLLLAMRSIHMTLMTQWTKSNAILISDLVSSVTAKELLSITENNDDDKKLLMLMNEYISKFNFFHGVNPNIISHYLKEKKYGENVNSNSVVIHQPWVWHFDKIKVYLVFAITYNVSL